MFPKLASVASYQQMRVDGMQLPKSTGSRPGSHSPARIGTHDLSIGREQDLGIIHPAGPIEVFARAAACECRQGIASGQNLYRKGAPRAIAFFHGHLHLHHFTADVPQFELVYGAVIALVAGVDLTFIARLAPTASGLYQAIGITLVLSGSWYPEPWDQDGDQECAYHLHRLFFRMILASALPIFRLVCQSSQAPLISPDAFLAQPRLL